MGAILAYFGYWVSSLREETSSNGELNFN